MKSASSLRSKILKSRSAYTKSSVITTIVVALFVGAVIYALVLTYLPTQPGKNATTTEILYVSGLTLISGSTSSVSFNKTCSGDTYLEIYVTNNSPNIYYVTNVTMMSYRSPSTNGTALIPFLNGCLPVSQSRPEIPQGADDVLIKTYPSVNVPPYTGWNVTIIFSDGQNVTQPNLQSQPD